MDIHEISHKLRYVAELLEDLWHYHQAGAHACPCSVCTKKQSLARSIISKASQEVMLVAGCMESYKKCEMKYENPDDLACSFNYSHGTRIDQDCELTVQRGSSSAMRQNSLDIEVHNTSDISNNIREQRKLSICSDSLKDSGLNTSYSLQSLSPLLDGKYHLKNVNNSQLQVSNILSEISDYDDGKADQATKFKNKANRILSNDRPHDQFDCFTASVETTAENVYTLESTCDAIQEQLYNRRNNSFNVSLNLQQSQASDSHKANLSLPALMPQRLMLLPLPLIMPSASVVGELSKKSASSEPLTRSVNITATTSKNNLPLPQTGNAAQQTCLTSNQPKEDVLPTPLTQVEDMNRIFLQVGENIHGLLIDNSYFPSQNTQTMSSNKKMTDSTLLRSCYVSIVDKTRKEQNDRYMQTEGCVKDTKHSNPSLMGSKQRQAVASYPQNLPSQSACAHERDCNLPDECKVAPEIANQKSFSFSVNHSEDRLFNSSVFDSMWRPWEIKDTIMGLISAESYEELCSKETKSLNQTSSKGFLTVQNDISAAEEVAIETGRELKIVDNNEMDGITRNTNDLEVNCLVSYTKQNIKPYYKSKSNSSSFMTREDILFNSSLSGSSSLTQQPNLDKQSNQNSSVDSSAGKVNSSSQFSKEKREAVGFNFMCKHTSNNTETNNTVPSTSNRRSFKCLSNILDSSKKSCPSLSSKLSRSPNTQDKDKENLICSNKASPQTSTSQLAVHKQQLLSNTQSVSPRDSLPNCSSKDNVNKSSMVLESCDHTSLVMSNGLHLTPPESTRNLVKLSTVKSKKIFPNSVISSQNPPDFSAADIFTSSSSKPLQWGAPAQTSEYYSTSESLKENTLESNILASKLKVVPKSQTESFKPVSNNLLVRNPGSSSKAKNNEITCSPEVSNIKSGASKFWQDGHSEIAVHNVAAVVHETRTGLNQTLPISGTLAHNHRSTLKQMNDSYEANQSFPKMTKSQQPVLPAASFCGKDPYQLSPDWSTSPAPRNRRSIFGCSKPDTSMSLKFQESKTNIKDHIKQPLEAQFVNNPYECGMRDLWSLLDACIDIGQVPTVKEVLFNCVTSSLCVVDSDRNGKIVAVNESFQFLIGVHEKVVGQKLFRFIKMRTHGIVLNTSFAHNFILADGHLASVHGKLAYCINASGESIPVSIWTVPFQPQPKLTMCVVGVSMPIQIDVYLNHHGSVLMYSEPFEAILGLTQEDEKRVCHVPDLDYSLIDRPQPSSLQTQEGATVHVMVTIASSGDKSLDKEMLGLESECSPIYSSSLSIFLNVSGLLVVSSDGIIQCCDRDYFRINCGLFHRTRKYQISELLSEVIRVDQDSCLSSANSSPDLQNKLNSTASDIALVDVSCLNEELSNAQNTDIKGYELYLPQSCFSSEGLVDICNSGTDGSGEEDNSSMCTDSFLEEPPRQDYVVLSATTGVGLYQTSTPCKKEGNLEGKEPKDVLMENGIYSALFLHANGSHVPVTFKLSHIKTSQKTLFCLWMYVQPRTNQEDVSDSDNDNQQNDSTTDDSTSDEEDIRQHLQNLNLNKSALQAGDISLGQLLMEQAGLNQSHNATSGTDVLDLEAAVDGPFGEKYILCEALGQGSFGFVRRARLLKSPATVVVKFIKKSKMFDDSWTADDRDNDKQIPLEVAILRETDCEHIIKLLDFHENDSFLQMVMEDFGETDLFDFIDQVDIDESLACCLFRQILWAIDYLHSKKIVHRDIKDENVVINRTFHCKLIDFGSAAYMLPDGEFFTKFRGTMEYCSPEVYNGERYQGPELDAWALGVTLYTILFRENPFTTSEVPGQLNDLPHEVTQDVLSLMLGLLDPNPCKRFTVQQALCCDWVRQFVDLSMYSWSELFGDIPVQSLSMIEIGIE